MWNLPLLWSYKFFRLRDLVNLNFLSQDHKNNQNQTFLLLNFAKLSNPSYDTNRRHNFLRHHPTLSFLIPVTSVQVVITFRNGHNPWRNNRMNFFRKWNVFHTHTALNFVSDIYLTLYVCIYVGAADTTNIRFSQPMSCCVLANFPSILYLIYAYITQITRWQFWNTLSNYLPLKGL